MKIAVAGGTGVVGSRVVAALQAQRHQTLILARSAGVDLTTGQGLAAMLEGVETVIDVSGTSSTSAGQSIAFFGSVTRSLLLAEQEAGVGHHVVLSVVGAAQVNASYYAGKKRQEELVMASGDRWSILRATQFYEFVDQLVGHGKIGPIQVVPTMRSRPLAAAEVAAVLADIAVGPPRSLLPDLAGPREERMADLVRRYLVATGAHRPVLEVPIPGRWGRGMRNGSLLPGPGARLGKQTFDQWLEEQ